MIGGMSLRLRLLLLVGLAVMLVAGAAAVWLPSRMDAIGRTWLERRAVSVSRILASAVAPALDFDDVPTAEKKLAYLERTPEVRWAILWRDDGTRFAQLHGERCPDAMPEATDEPELVFGDELAVVSMRLVTPSGIRGVLGIGISLDELRAEQRANLSAIALATALAFAFGLVAAWGVGNVIAAPITRLSVAARRVADGDLALEGLALHARDEWRDSADETRRLTKAVADVATRLAAQVRAIELSREHAEQAEERATAASAAKSGFLANMSHELRTPLNAVIGYSEMLIEDAEAAGDNDYLPDLRKISSAGRHLLGLINDILDISKIEAGRMEIYVEDGDLHEVVDTVVSTVRPLVEEKLNRLDVSWGPGVGPVRTDVTKVRQILFNLLSNAAKFTIEGQIRVELARVVRRDTGFVEITIRDSGIGMTKAQLERVFSPFVQADATTTKRFGGTGLGLTLVARFCEMLDGEVSVQSTYGVGTTFVVTLPERLQREVTPTPLRDERSGAGRRGRVLVVDDDPGVQALMGRILERAGFEVVAAHSGPEALELARSCEPIAITLDVMMPNMDGWDVLSRLKEDPGTADIPVVMVSMVEERDRGFALGASDFLIKPVEKAQLVRVLQRFVPEAAARVLVVEDDAAIRELMDRTLTEAGWTVTTARNGREGLELLDAAAPDVVLLDLMMPELDGFGFLEGIRSGERWAQTPVVVVTARSLTEEDRLRLQNRVSQVVQKGAWSADSLLREVEHAVRLHAPARATSRPAGPRVASGPSSS